MSERPKFTPEESEEIGKVAVDMANAGEDAINTASDIRIQLHKENIQYLEQNLYKPEALEVAKAMDHEIDVMNEIIRRARTIMQMEGTDSQSILEKIKFLPYFLIILSLIFR